VHGSWRGSLLGPFLLELRRILFLGTRVLNRLETDSPINHLSNLFKATRLYYLGVATRFSPVVSPRGGIQKNDSGLLDGQYSLIPQLALQAFIVLRCDFRAWSPG
jgi:hypothetical protein